MKHKEYDLQVSVCRYLSLQYPDVLFLSDTVASHKLTILQATRNKKIQKTSFKCPDLLILEPNKYFKGLFIELKTESPYKKDGQLKKNEHIEAQDKSMNDLNEKGYYCLFSWSLEQSINIINNYMNER